MALAGIKVIEFSGLAPVPFCGMVLADFGASVIRIDKFNEVMPDFLGNGKRSIVLNLKSEDGVKIVEKLCDRSDVVLDPFRAGVMEKLKLGPEKLMARNSKLIYARLTGYGQTGPFAKMAGHDINYLSLSGLLSKFGRFNEKPTPPVNFAADFAGGGLLSAFGIMLALYERNKSQTGQIIDTSMVEGAAYLGSWLYKMQNLPMLWDQPRGKNLLDTGRHFYDTYETKDGQYMAVGALEPQFYATLLEKLGLSQDEYSQFDNFEKSQTKFTQIFKTKTQDEWCKIFNGSDACVTPVLNFDNVASHPHNSARNSFALGEDNVIIPNPAPRLSKTPGVSCATKSPNIVPGEHTIEILTECKYSSKQIKKLIQNNIVANWQNKSKL